MPKRVRWDRFDLTYQKVTMRLVELMQGLKHGQTEPLMKVKMETPGQAINTTLQLRQYWTAVAAAFEKGEITSDDPRHFMASQASMLACRIQKKQPHVVELLHRSQLATSQGLAKALGILEQQVGDLSPAKPGPAVVPPEVIMPPLPMAQQPPKQEDLLGQQYGANVVPEATEK